MSGARWRRRRRPRRSESDRARATPAPARAPARRAPSRGFVSLPGPRIRERDQPRGFDEDPIPDPGGIRLCEHLEPLLAVAFHEEKRRRAGVAPLANDAWESRGAEP